MASVALVWPAVVVLLALSACGDDPRGRTAVQEPAPRATGGWTPLPRLPLGERARGLQDLTAVTVGRRLVVVAGASYAANRLHAATFDRSARRWRGVARAPLRWRAGYSAISTGSEVIVWGGTSNTGELADGARFDPMQRRWQRLPAAPLTGRWSHSAVWIGGRMLVWGGVGASGDRLADAAFFDPATGRWRRAPDAPIAGSEHQAAVWTGKALIVVSGGRAAMFTPADRAWSRLPPLPAHRLATVTLSWTGQEVLAWNGEDVMRLSANLKRWRLGARFPGVARDHETSVSAGGTLYVWGGRRSGCGGCWLRDGAAYRPSTDSWSRLPASPLRGRDRHAMVALGRDVFVWGGCCARSRYVSDGAVYEPPGVRPGATAGR